MSINQMFSLSMVVDKERFRKILTDKFDAEIHEENEKEYVDQSMASDGITVIYRNTQYKKKVKVIANLRLLLGDDEDDSEKLVRRLDKYIKKYFNYGYRLDNFRLSEVLFTVDIDVHNHDNVESYIKVLKRIGRVKGFSTVYYDCFDDKESFCLDGNSNGIQFLIYDLENLLKKEIARTGKGRKKLKSIATDIQGILRAEVRLIKPKVIREYADAVDVSEQLIELSRRRSEIFLDVFTQLVPYGDFHKKDKAVEVIHRNIKDSTMRRKMLRLLAMIPEKKSLYLAQKSMNCRDIEKVMDAFAKMNLSPVTISKRHDIKYLKSLYAYLL